MNTPTLADLRMAAIQGSLELSKIAAEASKHSSDCTCEGCEKKRAEEKKASHPVMFQTSTLHAATKLAFEVAGLLRKTAAEGGPMPTSTATTGGKGYPASFGHSPQADASKPSMKEKPPHSSAAGAVEESHAMGSEGKAASEGPGGLPESTGGQAGGKPIGGPPKGPTGLVSSNQAAIDATQGQAYAPRKKELGEWLKEPALSAASDTTLRDAFTHHDGAKVSFDVRISDVLKGKAEEAGEWLKSVPGKAVQLGRDLAGKGTNEQAKRLDMAKKTLDDVPSAVARHVQANIDELSSAMKDRQKDALKTVGKGVAATAGTVGAGLGIRHALKKKEDKPNGDPGEVHTASDLSEKTASAAVILAALEKEIGRG